MGTEQTPMRLKLGHPRIVLPEVDSTNSEVLRRADAGAAEGLTIIADRQTTGRGRQGRRWHTVEQHALAMSVLLKPRIAPEHASQIPLMTAVALHAALSSFAPDIRIKWPNDILYQGRKLAGILTEMRTKSGHVESVVPGIGINIRSPDNAWPDDIKDIATDLTTASGHTNINISRMDIAGSILESLDHYYHKWLQEGFAFVREQWWQAHAACGKRVRVHDGRCYLEGIAEALDEDGALLLRTPAGLQRIIAGDLELMEVYHV